MTETIESNGGERALIDDTTTANIHILEPPATETDQHTVTIIKSSDAGKKPLDNASERKRSFLDAGVSLKFIINSKSVSPEESEDEKELPEFKPGDHVIRWEMLPIAWPIQVHGIVLEAYEGNIVLVDFGLTAIDEKGMGGHKMEEAKNLDETPKEENNPKRSFQYFMDAKQRGEAMKSIKNMFDRKEMEGTMKNLKKKFDRKEIEESVKSINPGKGKQRLNVRVINEPSEIRKWKKVNYDGGLFGLGGNGDEEGGGKGKKIMKQMNNFVNDKKPKVQNFLKQVSTKFQKRPSSQESVVTNETIDENEESAVKTLEDGTSTTIATEESTQEKTPPSTKSDVPESPTKETSSSPGAEVDQASFLKEAVDKHDELEKKEPESKPKRFMNPAMARIMNRMKPTEEKGEQSEELTEDEKKQAEEDKKQAEEDKKPPKPKLPKADPPKLVLARTRWLLEHGESILPPYHCFHSNSECIAVFCKTGYWSNLQADVFLHSTAIGNAKTMGAATLGAAASIPLLAPVVGVAGIALVGAPWMVLKKAKEKAEEITQQLTDAFWAQAENEVIIECITNWTKFPGEGEDEGDEAEAGEGDNEGAENKEVGEGEELSKDNKTTSKEENEKNSKSENESGPSDSDKQLEGAENKEVDESKEISQDNKMTSEGDIEEKPKDENDSESIKTDEEVKDEASKENGIAQEKTEVVENTEAEVVPQPVQDVGKTPEAC